MRIGQKITTGFLAVTLLIAISSTVGVKFISDTIAEIVEKKHTKLEAILQLQLAEEEAVKEICGYLVHPVPERKQRFWQVIDRIKETVQIFHATTATPKETELHEEIDELINNCIHLANELFVLKDQEARLVDAKGKGDEGLVEKFEKSIHDLEHQLEKVQVDRLTSLMLQIRRAEKSYLLRGQQKYASQIKDLVSEFRGQLQASNLGLVNISLFNSLLDDYYGNFEQVVKIDNKINNLAGVEHQLVDQGDEHLIRIHNILEKELRGIVLGSIMADRVKVLYAKQAISIVICISLAAAFFLSLLISRSISRPIIKLKNAASKIGKGYLDTKININSKDEVGELAQSFMNMLKDLKKSTTSIEHLNHEVVRRKQAQQAQQNAKEAAEASSKAKSSFLANMSHEIRTPMNAVIGFSDILAEENLTADQKYYVSLIQQASKDLLSLINDILDLSKIEAGKFFDIEIIDSSLAEVLTPIDSMFQQKAAEKSIKFGIIEHGVLPANIQTDSSRLRQCLINLVSNAMKFTDNGHVLIHVRGEQAGGDSLIRFDVEDTGTGIPSEKLETIFEPFEQVKSGASQKTVGTGLGLAITKRLVQLLGGKISVASKLGIGSTFSIVMPTDVGIDCSQSGDDAGIRDEASVKLETLLESAEQTEGEKQSDRKPNILVVEDNANNQVLIKVLLEKIGSQVTIAENGRKAIAVFEEGKFDLVLMDIRMPDMNGFEVTEHLRNRGVRTPIIALTACATIGDEDKCLQAGCDGYLSKPICAEELYKKINEFLQVAVQTS